MNTNTTTTTVRGEIQIRHPRQLEYAAALGRLIGEIYQAIRLHGHGGVHYGHVWVSFSDVINLAGFRGLIDDMVAAGNLIRDQAGFVRATEGRAL